jgi:hypothetical protein
VICSRIGSEGNFPLAFEKVEAGLGAEGMVVGYSRMELRISKEFLVEGSVWLGGWGFSEIGV